jgi:hypothetical protein
MAELRRGWLRVAQMLAGQVSKVVAYGHLHWGTDNPADATGRLRKGSPIEDIAWVNPNSHDVRTRSKKP